MSLQDENDKLREQLRNAQTDLRHCENLVDSLRNERDRALLSWAEAMTERDQLETAVEHANNSAAILIEERNEAREMCREWERTLRAANASRDSIIFKYRHDLALALDERDAAEIELAKLREQVQ